MLIRKKILYDLKTEANFTMEELANMSEEEVMEWHGMLLGHMEFARREAERAEQEMKSKIQSR